jgi:hypothetical protein
MAEDEDRWGALPIAVEQQLAWARDPSCPPHVLAGLVFDWPFKTAACFLVALGHPAFPDHLRQITLLRLVTRNWGAAALRDLPDCDPNTLCELVTATTVYHATGDERESGMPLLKAVAEHPRCPETLLAYLAGHSSLAEAVARHPNTPPEVLHSVVRDEMMRINSSGHRGPGPACVQVLIHPRCPPALRDQLMDPKHLVEPEGGNWRHWLLKEPQCPVPMLVRILRQMQESNQTVWVKAVLEHPNLPEEYRELGRVAQ